MANADDVEPDFHLLPKNMQALVKYVGFPDMGGMSDEEKQIYDRLRAGHCMTCNKQLGEHANFIITAVGIVGGYCNGVCHSDMAVLGYLQEQHADLTERINFREGRTADVADAETTAEDDE